MNLNLMCFCSPGLVYLAGGSTDPTGVVLRSLESYNPVTGEWNSLASMKHKRSHCSIGVLGNDLYVVGGLSGDKSVLRSVERYSILEVSGVDIIIDNDMDKLTIVT